MSKRRFLPLGLAVSVAAVLVTAAIVGSGAAAPRATTFKAALISDVGRFNDKGFNQNQLTGLNMAKRRLKIQTRAIESRSAGDYIPNLTRVARERFNVIISAGFLLNDATKTVADRFRNLKFGITDVDVRTAPFNGRRSPNVMGSTFATEENSYLVGCLAGLITRRQGGRQVISVTAGVKIPPVDTFLAGYRAGARKCNPRIRVLFGYSQTFIEQDKCKEIALNQIAEGSQVVFNVAGPCGLGALDAARERGKWGIGVDVDQSFLGRHILTSAVKRVDLWVYRVIQAAKNGKFRGGRNLSFDLKNRGVAVGKIS
ncbi:MAG: BMP family ABC transporter substrate-binding protein, partial [Actinomycetota bacterium]|nr:BMP family ABC transporter substrate-binding protein [Actinomycetota bacterium]